MPQNKQSDNNFLLITYPRTGSHFIYAYLRQLTGFEIKKSHFPRWSGDKKVITVIRDPEETLKSCFTMHKDGALARDPNYDWETAKHDAIITNVNGYILFFEYMAENADVIIDYKTLIDDPYRVCKFLAEYLGLNIAEEEEYIQVLEDAVASDRPKGSDHYLVSSKTSKYYESMDISWLDLSKHYDIYHKVLSKKTI
jgi:hypothetical protein